MDNKSTLILNNEDQCAFVLYDILTSSALFHNSPPRKKHLIRFHFPQILR